MTSGCNISILNIQKQENKVIFKHKSRLIEGEMFGCLCWKKEAGVDGQLVTQTLMSFSFDVQVGMV